MWNASWTRKTTPAIKENHSYVTYGRLLSNLDSFFRVKVFLKLFFKHQFQPPEFLTRNFFANSHKTKDQTCHVA